MVSYKMLLFPMAYRCWIYHCRWS